MTKVTTSECNNKDERMKMIREMVIRENAEKILRSSIEEILQIKITGGGKNILQLILLNFCKSNFEHEKCSYWSQQKKNK